MRKLIPYRFSLLLVALSFLVMTFSSTLQEIFRYQSAAVSQGEVWRIFTANLCHSNWNHWLLNMLGLMIMDLFFRPVLNESLRVMILLFTMLGSVLFLHLLIDINWYVGLSGALHGYIFAGSILSWDTAKKTNAIILAFVLGKVIVENIWQINNSTEKLIAANVVEESHLFGVVSAVVFCILLTLYRQLLLHFGKRS
jgi:rhomboid family GlyGly-CTERM serine protease